MRSSGGYLWFNPALHLEEKETKRPRDPGGHLLQMVCPGKAPGWAPNRECVHQKHSWLVFSQFGAPHDSCCSNSRERPFAPKPFGEPDIGVAEAFLAACAVPSGSGCAVPSGSGLSVYPYDVAEAARFEKRPTPLSAGIPLASCICSLQAVSHSSLASSRGVRNRQHGQRAGGQACGLRHPRRCNRWR